MAERDVAGLAQLLGDRDPGTIDLVGHGTTVATNALLTRRLPNGGIVTTASVSHDVASQSVVVSGSDPLSRSLCGASALS